MCKSVSMWCLRPHCPDIGRCVYVPLRVRTCMHVRLNNCAYDNTCLNVLWVYKNMKMYAYQYIYVHMITCKCNCIFIAFLVFRFPFILKYFNFLFPTRCPFSSSSDIIFSQAVSSLSFFLYISSLFSLSESISFILPSRSFPYMFITLRLCLGKTRPNMHEMIWANIYARQFRVQYSLNAT